MRSFLDAVGYGEFKKALQLGSEDARTPLDRAYIGLARAYAMSKRLNDAYTTVTDRPEDLPKVKADVSKLTDTQVGKDGMKAVYLEYAWNMSWCDPCAADPIPDDKLAELGAFWVKAAEQKKTQPTQPSPRVGIQRPQNAFITRLHVRYDAKNFPEDLMFQETADSSNFQGRYVMRHAYNGTATCPAAEEYRRSLEIRHAQEAATLSTLTGWKIDDIREKMKKGE